MDPRDDTATPGGSPATLAWHDELGWPEGLDEPLRELLLASFGSSEGGAAFARRRWFKQLATRRLVALRNGEVLGHLAVDHRVCGVAGEPVEILGIHDVCVRADARGAGLAGALLAEAEALGRRAGVRFLVLFADDPRLYERAGYERAGNPLRWTRIHEHQTLGVGEGPVEALMVRALTSRPWPTEKEIDLLGTLF